MAEHILKTEAVYWDATYEGRKPFEVRENDRAFQVGDIVILQRFEGRYPTLAASGERLGIRKRIGWILQGGRFGIAPGYCVFSLEDME